MYILIYESIPTLILFICIYADIKSPLSHRWKRFSTAWIGMVLVQLVLFALAGLITYLFVDPEANLQIVALTIFIVSLALAFWASLHIPK